MPYFQLPLEFLGDASYYRLALEFLGEALLPVLFGYPLLWMVFGRDREGVINAPWYWHLAGILWIFIAVMLIRFAHTALSGEEALFHGEPNALSVFMTFGLPLVIALLVVRRIRKKALWRVVSRSYAHTSTKGERDARDEREARGEERNVRGDRDERGERDVKRPIAEREASAGTLEGVDESILLAIDDELETGNIDRATWTRAYAEADGVENRAKALYIRLRAAKLQGARREPYIPKNGKGGGVPPHDSAADERGRHGY